MMAIFRNLRHFLAGNDRFGGAPFSRLSESYDKTRLLVRFFYLASTYKIAVDMMKLHNMAFLRPEIDPVWPLFWIGHVDLLLVTDLIGLSTFLLALTSFLKPDSSSARIGFAASMLLMMSLPPSLGAVNHGNHAWFWTAAVLAFLPGPARTRAGKLNYCLGFGTAQALLMTFYSMAGSWKLAFGIAALVQDRPGNFAPEGLALLLADRMSQTGTQPLLGPFLVDHFLFAWPMFLFLIYAQFVALAIAFRPSLHIPWGLILVGFHTGTFLMMEIDFPTHIFLALLLMVASPFQRHDWMHARTLALLPGAGMILKWGRWRSKSVQPVERLA